MTSNQNMISYILSKGCIKLAEHGMETGCVAIMASSVFLVENDVDIVKDFIGGYLLHSNPR